MPIDGPFREFGDIELVCKGCQQPFIFEAGEQAFFADSRRNWPAPTKCKPCRKARKENRWPGHVAAVQEAHDQLVKDGRGALAKELTFVLNDMRKLTDYQGAKR